VQDDRTIYCAMKKAIGSQKLTGVVPTQHFTDAAAIPERRWSKAIEEKYGIAGRRLRVDHFHLCAIGNYVISKAGAHGNGHRQYRQRFLTQYSRPPVGLRTHPRRWRETARRRGETGEQACGSDAGEIWQPFMIS